MAASGAADSELGPSCSSGRRRRLVKARGKARARHRTPARLSHSSPSPLSKAARGRHGRLSLRARQPRAPRRAENGSRVGRADVGQRVRSTRTGQDPAQGVDEVPLRLPAASVTLQVLPGVNLAPRQGRARRVLSAGDPAGWATLQDARRGLRPSPSSREGTELQASGDTSWHNDPLSRATRRRSRARAARRRNLQVCGPQIQSS